MRRYVVRGLLLIGFVALATNTPAEVITWKAEGKGGAVAAGKINSVAAGAQILADGGHSASAAVATLLALSVSDYGMCAIGGEVPLLIYDAKTKQVKALSGLGAAPIDPKAIKWFYENGIPSDGSMKAAPVPGAVDLCVTTLRMSGTMSFEQVSVPMLKLLDADHEASHAELGVTSRKLVQRERETSGRLGGKVVGGNQMVTCVTRGEPTLGLGLAVIRASE